MIQWCFDAFENVAIDSRVFAGHFEMYRLSEGAPEIPDRPGKRLNAVRKRTHAAIQHFLVQASGKAGKSAIEMILIRQAVQQRLLEAGHSVLQLDQAPYCPVFQRNSGK